jgi:hypothetical protein
MWMQLQLDFLFRDDDDDTVPAVEKYKDESFDTSAPKTLKELQEYAESNLETGDLLIMDCTHRFGKIAQLFTPNVMSLHVRSTANQ